MSGDPVSERVVEVPSSEPRRRGPPSHCERCGRASTHRKARCVEHVLELPYPARVVELLDMAACEERRVEREGHPRIDEPGGALIALDILAVLYLRGMTEEGLARFLDRPAVVCRRFGRVLAHFGAVRMRRSQRGSTVYHLVGDGDPLRDRLERVVETPAHIAWLGSAP